MSRGLILIASFFLVCLGAAALRAILMLTFSQTPLLHLPPVQDSSAASHTSLDPVSRSRPLQKAHAAGGTAQDAGAGSGPPP